MPGERGGGITALIHHRHRRAIPPAARFRARGKQHLRTLANGTGHAFTSGISGSGKDRPSGFNQRDVAEIGGAQAHQPWRGTEQPPPRVEALSGARRRPPTLRAYRSAISLTGSGFGPSRLLRRALRRSPRVVEQDARRSPLEIIILAAPERPQKQGETARAEGETDPDEIEQHRHQRRNRKLFSITTNEEADIAAAASHGVTQPAIANGTITAL